MRIKIDTEAYNPQQGPKGVFTEGRVYEVIDSIEIEETTTYGGKHIGATNFYSVVDDEGKKIAVGSGITTVCTS